MTVSGVGVDAGGSFLRVTVGVIDRPDGDVRRVDRTVESRPPHVHGWESAVESVRATVVEALADAGADGDPGVLVAGIAGAGAAANRGEWAARLRAAFPASDIEVVADHAIVLGGSAAGPVVAAIVGTGVVVAGRDPQGRVSTVDGWGPIFGDRGSAFALGRDAVAAALAAIDGRGPTTVLGERLAAALGLDGIEDAPVVLRMVDPGAVRSVAALAPIVLAAGRDGDAVAASVVAVAVDDLAAAIATTAGRIGGPPYELVVSGGLGVGAADFRTAVLAGLAGRAVAPSEVVLVADPSRRACEEALRRVSALGREEP